MAKKWDLERDIGATKESGRFTDLWGNPLSRQFPPDIDPRRAIAIMTVMVMAHDGVLRMNERDI